MTASTDWRGRVGRTWAEERRGTERSFADLAIRLDAAILAAAPAGPFRALDIGSGAGGTSIALAAARPDAEVIGVDLSPDLVAASRLGATIVKNASFQEGDAAAVARRLTPIDLFVSRHGVMFFPDPVAAFATLAAAASPAARLVFSCFAELAANPWATILAGGPAAISSGYVPGPFAFADPIVVRSILIAAGWSDPGAERIDFAYRLGTIEEAAIFLRRIGPSAAILRDAAQPDLAALDDRLAKALARARDGDSIAFPAAAWIWTAHRSGETA